MHAGECKAWASFARQTSTAHLTTASLSRLYDGLAGRSATLGATAARSLVSLAWPPAKEPSCSSSSKTGASVWADLSRSTPHTMSAVRPLGEQQCRLYGLLKHTCWPVQSSCAAEGSMWIRHGAPATVWHGGSCAGGDQPPRRHASNHKAISVCQRQRTSHRGHSPAPAAGEAHKWSRGSIDLPDITFCTSPSSVRWG